jgi:hypothetical protein
MRRRQPQKIICDNCGKEGLEYRAFAYWSVKEQKFVVDDIDWDYEPWCPECQCDVEVSEAMILTGIMSRGVRSVSAMLK